MSLGAHHHVPQVLQAEVLGEDGSKAWGVTHPGLVTADLWVQDQDRANMARLQLTRAGCVAAAELLLELGRALPE
jgi:hypothetical protein